MNYKVPISILVVGCFFYSVYLSVGTAVNKDLLDTKERCGQLQLDLVRAADTEKQAKIKKEWDAICTP